MSSPGERVKVFISSATGDHLGKYRRVAVDVCHRLQLIPVNMEQFLSQSPPPLDVCYREVDSADIFVLIVAHRYGSVPDGMSASYTELEYRRARARDIPIYAFIADDRTPWPPADVDQDTGSRERFERFVRGLRGNHTVTNLGMLDEFRENLLLTLQRSFGSGPDTSTQALRRILPSAPELHAVPPYVSTQPFVGREAELKILGDWAQSDDAVLVFEAIGGLGKSALAWNWLTRHASRDVDELAGRLWWSFYDGSASIARFLHELAAYLTGWSVDDCARLDGMDLLSTVASALRARRYVLVLDGFERLLTAYHKFDPTKLRDDEVEGGARGSIDPFSSNVLRTLTTCAPSKIIIASRLMPDALEGSAGWPIPGVRHHRLPGLAGSDVVRLTRQLGVAGDEQAIQAFFDRLGNHPLLIGAVCGLVRDHRNRPGDFDLWRTDPSGGQRIGLRELGLSQRQTRVLAAAFAGLSAESRQVLECLTILPGGVSYKTLQAVNPLLPDPPKIVRAWPTGTLHEWLDEQVAKGAVTADEKWRERNRLLAKYFEQQATARSRWSDSPEALGASAALDQALDDLERRGLLMWDRSSNVYDLHPVIRAFAYDEIETADRSRLNYRVQNHFTALPPENINAVTSVEDLQQSITVFRALVGCDQLEQAASIFARRLERTLLWKLGANLTVIELLEPLNCVELSQDIRGSLGIAYNGCRRLDDSLNLTLIQLSDALASDNAWFLTSTLHNLVVQFLNARKLAAAKRMLSFIGTIQPEWEGQKSVLSLHEAALARVTGDLELAERLLQDARTAPRPKGHPGFEAEVEIEALTTAFEKATLREGDLGRLQQLDDQVLGQYYMGIEQVKYNFWLAQGRLGKALEAAEAYRRAGVGKGVGASCGLALTAKVFAHAGNTSQAAELVDEALIDIDRLHPAIRPYLDIALVLARIGDQRARDFGERAYRQAWADGPPFCDVTELGQAKALLTELGAPVPALPTTNPDAVTIPCEDAIRAWSARRETSG